MEQECFRPNMVFISSHYDQLKRVYSIWIFPSPSKKFENSLTEFYIDQKHIGGQRIPNLLEKDLMRIIFIGLGDPEKAEEESIWRMLGVLLSNQISVEKKRNILEFEYGLKMTRSLEKEVMEVSNLGQGVFEKGLAQGRTEERLEMLHKVMKKLNFDIEQALQFVDIPQDQQEMYRELLKDQA